ncbi:MAG: general secretion pathway protein GspK [Halobacteriovoraceae bacterium]|nr:general secretion pathway protein GspK [Halobacteriovoraceae bacterium]
MKNFSSLINNSKGVALLMVITAITLLSLLMFTFRFDTGVNKIKAYNMTSKAQARLNAESGLHLALIRLEIYQQALNYLNKNNNLNLPTEIFNQIWSFPLKFPLEITPEMGIIDRSAIEKFLKNLVIEGEIITSISSYSNKININGLRASKLTKFVHEISKNQAATTTPGKATGGIKPTDPNDPGITPPEEDPNENPNEAENDQVLEMEKRFKELLERTIEKKLETDSYFYSKYSGLDLDLLIATIKYYISDKGQDIGPLTNTIAAEFEKIGITPKHAPMTSLSELYMLPGWSDELVNLIKNEITVHGVMVIDVNNITANMLRLLIAEISDDDIKAFYEYKNDPANPITFESVNDIRNYFANEARIINSGEFDDRVELLKKAGISFGSRPALFKVVSTGTHNSAEYTINAIVSIDRKVMKEDSKKGGFAGGTQKGGDSKPNKKEKYEYAKPRVLEIYIN